ncbi:MAG: hypothetical protein KGO49_14465 [Gammaproteobacteria bacterium]|nr:hypothetical protein [Gammaproteobacteria bacterium]
MIHSSVMDNWMQVKIMHSIAKDYYEKTIDTEYRHLPRHSLGFYAFDLEKAELMEKECCVVGMVIVWSIVTLESLINHVIAEVINNRLLAVLAIEFPGNVTDKVGGDKTPRSDLAKKIRILNQGAVEDKKIIELANSLSKIRNEIVHDKPFSFNNLEDGEFSIEYFNSRDDGDRKRYNYDDLSDFYKKCEELTIYIDKFYKVTSFSGEHVDFRSLLDNQ